MAVGTSTEEERNPETNDLKSAISRASSGWPGWAESSIVFFFTEIKLQGRFAAKIADIERCCF